MACMNMLLKSKAVFAPGGAGFIAVKTDTPDGHLVSAGSALLSVEHLGRLEFHERRSKYVALRTF